MTSADDAEHIRNLGRRIRNLETSLGAACNEVDETRTRLAEAERLLRDIWNDDGCAYLGPGLAIRVHDAFDPAGERGLAAENVQNQTVPAANPSGLQARLAEAELDRDMYLHALRDSDKNWKSHFSRACHCACHRTGPKSPACRDCLANHPAAAPPLTFSP